MNLLPAAGSACRSARAENIGTESNGENKEFLKKQGLHCVGFLLAGRATDKRILLYALSLLTSAPTEIEKMVLERL